MTVEIPPEYRPFVQAVIARGGFQTEAEVVGEALRLLQERDRHVDALRREVQLGLDDLERGDYTEYDDESLRQFFEQVKAEGRQALDQGSTGS
jgi:antitoxin ParD1/3/4